MDYQYGKELRDEMEREMGLDLSALLEKRSLELTKVWNSIKQSGLPRDIWFRGIEDAENMMLMGCETRISELEGELAFMRCELQLLQIMIQQRKAVLLKLEEQSG